MLAYFMEEAEELCHGIERTGMLSDEDREQIVQLAGDYQKRYTESRNKAADDEK